jgi:hypothetical protein
VGWKRWCAFFKPELLLDYLRHFVLNLWDDVSS